jgi:hypothetical protein
MGIILRTQKMAAGHAAAAFINIASFFVLRHVFFAETFSTWGNSGIEPDKGPRNQLSRNV